MKAHKAKTQRNEGGGNLQGANLNLPQEEMLLNVQEFRPGSREQNPWV